MVLPTARGALVSREPVARHLPDRGRLVALAVLSTVADAVRAVVPPLLAALGVSPDDWERRLAAFDKELWEAVLPYDLRLRLLERDPKRPISVDAAGRLIDGHRILAPDDVASRLSRR